MRRAVIGALAGTVLLMTVDACGGDDPTEPGAVNISDPARFEAVMRQVLLPGMTGVFDALERVLVAIDGGPADGVTITPTQSGVDAVVAIDFDGDGTREGSVSGSFIGDISVGAQLTITSVERIEPSLTAGGSMSVRQTSPGMVLLDNIGGSGSADPPGSENAAEVVVTDGTITVDISNAAPDGFIDCVISGEGNSLSVTAATEPDGQGGFRIRFTGPGLNFTVP